MEESHSHKSRNAIQGGRLGFEDLNKDLLHLIFRKFSTTDIAANFMPICQSWRSIGAEMSQEVMEVDLYDLVQRSRKDYCLALQRRVRITHSLNLYIRHRLASLTVLDIRGGDFGLDNFLLQSVFLAIKCCPQLRVLRLDDDHDLRWQQEPFEVKALPKSLEVLQVTFKLALNPDIQSEPAQLRVYQGYATSDYGLSVPVTSSISAFLHLQALLLRKVSGGMLDWRIGAFTDLHVLSLHFDDNGDNPESSLRPIFEADLPNLEQLELWRLLRHDLTKEPCFSLAKSHPVPEITVQWAQCTPEELAGTLSFPQLKYLYDEILSNWQLENGIQGEVVLPGVDMSQSALLAVRIARCCRVEMDFAGLLQAPKLSSFEMKGTEWLSFRHPVPTALTPLSRDLDVYIEFSYYRLIPGYIVEYLTELGFEHSHDQSFRYTRGNLNACALASRYMVHYGIDEMRTDCLGSVFKQVMPRCGSSGQCDEYFKRLLGS